MLTGFLSRANISLNCPTGLLKSMTVANKHKKELKAIEKAGSGFGTLDEGRKGPLG